MKAAKELGKAVPKVNLKTKYELESDVQAIANQSCLGVVKYSVDSTDINMRFGVWNDRPVSEAQLRQLMKSFWNDGVWRNTQKSRIAFGFSESQLHLDKLKPVGTPIDDLTDLTDIFKTVPNEITPYNGQHRTNAICAFVSDVLPKY